MATAARLNDFRLGLAAKLYTGQVHWAMGSYQDGKMMLEAAADSLPHDALYERFDLFLLPASVIARFFGAFCLTELGEFSLATMRANEALEIAEAVEHPLSLAEALFAKALVCLRQRRVAEGVPVLERMLELCRARHISLMVPTGSSWLGWAYVIGGRVDEGMRLLADSLALAKSMGMVVGYSNCYSLLAQAHLFAGRLDDAAEYARDLLEQAGRRNERGWFAYALHLSAESAAQKSSPDLALRYYTDALVAAKELGMRPLVAHCHLGLGKLDQRTGRRDQAQEHLTTATTMYREMDMRFWLEKAEAELMELG